MKNKFPQKIFYCFKKIKNIFELFDDGSFIKKILHKLKTKIKNKTLLKKETSKKQNKMQNLLQQLNKNIKNISEFLKIFKNCFTIIFVILFFLIGAFFVNTKSAFALAVGDTYGGGKVFYIFVPGDVGYVAGQTRGLTAATSDQTDLNGAQWGCSGVDIPGAEGTAIGTGNQNTTDIINGCATSGIAARLAHNYNGGGFTDWYLPSLDEATKMYTNRSSIGGFVSTGQGAWYWTSTELSGNPIYAIMKDMEYGYQTNNPKGSAKSSNGNYVRAIRTFIYDTTPPSVNISYSSNPVKAGTETITATYSEPISSTPNISIDQLGSTDISNAAMTTTGNGATWISETSISSGWDSVAYGNGIFLAVSNTGKVMTSPDGINWVQRTTSSADSWNSVTYGNGLFVVANDHYIMTSPDGITWTNRATLYNLRSVTYGNGLFVAVSNYVQTNQVITSPDGITWTARTAIEANSWYSVTYGNGLFVAVSYDGTHRVMTSTDGITWVAQTAAEANSWYSVTYGNGLFVAVAGNGTNRVMTSTDGITWVARTAAEANAWRSVIYGNGIFLAVASSGTNRIMTSTDGITWTAQTAAEANNWYSVTYGNGLFVAVASNGTHQVMISFTNSYIYNYTVNTATGGTYIDGKATVSLSATADPSGNVSGSPTNNSFMIDTTGPTPAITYSSNPTKVGTETITATYNEPITSAPTISINQPGSTNISNASMTNVAGSNWTMVTNGTFSSIAYGNGIYVGVSGAVGSYIVKRSINGSTWTTQTIPENNNWTSLTYGNGLFVAVANTGIHEIMTSPDGITWTAQTAAEANNWYNITYGNGLFVTVASSGTHRVMTSPDGITWTARSAAEANSWYSVTYGNGLFVAVASYGTHRVMTSPDGITWTAQTAAEANTWDGVTYGNSLFVAVSVDGTHRVMTSPDGITWTAQTAAEANTWVSITYGNGLFVSIANSNTTSHTIMVSSDGANWVAKSSYGGLYGYCMAYGNSLFVSCLSNTMVAKSPASQYSYIYTVNQATGDTYKDGTATVSLSSTADLAGNSSTAPTGNTFTIDTTSPTVALTYTKNPTGAGTQTITANYSENVSSAPTISINQPGTTDISNATMVAPASVWTAQTAAETGNWNGLAYGNGLFVAIAQTGVHRIMTSPDGITWTARTSSEVNGWVSVTYGNGLFVAVAYNGTNRIMTSPDGITWTVRAATELNNWDSITYGNGLFVAVANNGANRIMTSPDGITWTARAATEANLWASITYGNGLFVAVSQDGTHRIMTSTDGITWVASTSVIDSWKSIAYGNGVFVSVSTNNQAMTSPDGITWISRTIGGYPSLAYVTYGNGLFVAVGSSGAIRTSSDGITWTAQTAAESNSWLAITYGNGFFVAVSQSGTHQVMTSPASYTYNYNVNAANGSTYVDGNAIVSLSSTTDAAGNTTSAPTNNNFTIDTVGPTVALTYQKNPAGLGVNTITATYNKALSSTPNISIDQPGSVDITTQAMSGSGLVYTYSYTVVKANGSTYIDGTANVSLSTTTDTLGNTSSAPTGTTFVIDTTPPNAALTYSITHAVKTGDTQTITATFNKVMSDTPIPQIAISGANTLALTNMTKVDTTHYTYAYTVGTGDGTATVTLGTGTDLAGNVITTNPTSGGTFTIDNTLPVSTITAICSVGGNGCTTAGQGATPQESYKVQTISGTASDVGSGLNTVNISIKDTNTNKWYGGSLFNSDTENYILVTGTTTWTYDMSLIALTMGDTYLVHVKPIDVAGNSQVSNLSFKFTNSPPTVSNVTASEGSTGLVTVHYDVTDIESAQTTNYLFYKIVGGGLNGTITSGATSLVVSDGTNFPATGTILIDDEMITYASKSTNTLNGLTRGALNSTPFAHTTGADIFVKANSATGNVGLLNIGTGKTITWQANTDADGYESTSEIIKVVANDGSTASMVGSLASSAFILDAKKPTAVVTFEAGIAGLTNSAVITIPMPTDISAVQYKISDDPLTQTNPTDTGWVNITQSTTIPWTFDSDIEAKTIKYQYRDAYGNITSEVATSTQAPVPSGSFIVQDTSNISAVPPYYDMYIGWQAVSATGFASYKLEYATSTDNTNYGNYTALSDPGFSVVTNNYYVFRHLDSAKFYRFRLAVVGTNGNTSVRSNSFVTAKPDGVQNYGEGGGGSVAAASEVQNVVVTQNIDKTVTVNYKLTDSSVAKKLNPSYESYLFYNIGITLPDNSFDNTNNTLTLTDASKLQNSGYIEVNNEVIKYTNKTGNVLSGLIRGTWPTLLTSGRVTRTDPVFFAGTPVWIMANNTTPIAIGNTSIATGQTGTINWNTYNESAIMGSAYPNTGIKVLVHDNQDVGSGPLSSQNDFSENGILSSLDLTPPAISFSTTSSSGLENVSPVVLTLNLDRAYPIDSTVHYTLSGTATGGGQDFTLADGTATITAGQTTTNINIPIVNDTLKETNETVIVTLSNPTNAVLGTNSVYTYTITDDDNLPTLQFSNPSGSGLESITSVDVPLTLSEISGTDTTVSYTVSGTAIGGGVDYTLADGTATITAGQTTTNINIPIVNDTLKEDNETIIITLSNPVGANLGTNNIYTYTITDDDNLPVIQFTNPNGLGLENITSVDIPVSIPAIYPQDVTVSYSVTGGTATGGGVDYTLADGTATIVAGQTSTNINVNVVDDDISEPTKTIEITLSNPTNAILGTNTIYTYSILDNEIAVTGIGGSDIKSTSAVITWTTADYADSTITYGTLAPGNDGAYNLTKTNGDKVLNHRIYLSHLTPATEYFFKTSSTNLNGDLTTSESNFTTTPGPVISGVSVNNITDTNATVTWTTDIPATSYVPVFTKMDKSDLGMYGIDGLVTNHSVILTNLEALKTYYFVVNSSDALINGNAAEETNDEAYYTFTTTADITPPVISDISVPIITSTSLAIVWKTNESADGQILYGTETGVYPKSTTLSSSLILNHLATVFDLTPLTDYYYVINSKDTNGNLATSSEQTVKTTKVDSVSVSRVGVMQDVYDALLAENEANKAKLLNQSSVPPVISNIKVSDVNAFGATVSFDTDKDTIGGIDYGKDTKNYTKNEGDFVWGKNHQIKLTGLTMGIDYYFKVKAVDKSSNIGTSDEQAFKTKFFSENLADLTKIDNIEQFQSEIESTIESILPSLVPPFIETPVISDITESSAVITFKTNIKSYPIVNYTTDGNYDATKDKPYDGEVSDTTAKSLDHTLQLIGLKPNMKYHLMAKAFSLPQVVGKSEDLTFSTEASKIKASVVDRKNDSFSVVWTTDDPTSSIVEYKNLKTGRVDRMTDDAKNTSHSVKVENLIPGTTYQVSVSGINDLGNTVEGAESINVNTSTDTTPPIISNFKVDSALVLGRTDKTQTIVSWTTDEPSTSVVYFEEGPGAPDKALTNKKEDDELTVSHVVILTTLRPGTVYRFQVASTDNASNIAQLPIRTIITPKPTESIVDVIFKNFDETFNFIKNVK